MNALPLIIVTMLFLLIHGSRQVSAAQKNIVDIHCHAAGIGAGASGCFVSPALRNSWKYRMEVAHENQ